MTDKTIWTSNPMQIGKHEWRVIVYETHGPNCEGGKLTVGPYRCQSYQWRRTRAPDSLTWDDWHDPREWPDYNHNNGETAGMPRSLKRLYEEHERMINWRLCEQFDREPLPPQPEKQLQLI